MLTLALCTVAHHAQVGQEGIGEADQMPGYNGGPIGAVLVVAEPQQLLGVFHKRLNRPPAFLRQHEASRRKLRLIGHQPEHLPCLSFA